MPSRPSSTRSTSTARPCTCARRSSTTSTWSSSSVNAGRSSSKRRPRCRRARWSSSPRTAWRRASTQNAAVRNLRTIDATCPLVTKVHVEARKFAEQGYTMILIGHEGHEEVEGTTGEAPEHIVLVQTADDVDRLRVPEDVPDPDKLAFITQTTLSVDETSGIIARLRERFPKVVSPKSDDICYATTNRQIAVKQLAQRVRPRARDRLDQLVQLPAPGRRHPRARNRVASDRQRLAGARGVARRASRPSASPPAPAPPRSWSRSSSTSSATAARRTSRSCAPSTRTCASCSRSRSASSSPRTARPAWTSSARTGIESRLTRVPSACSHRRETALTGAAASPGR